MLFNSPEFVALMLCTFILYYAPVVRRIQVPVLVLSSFVFYAANSPSLLVLLLSSIAINAISSFVISYCKRSLAVAVATLGVVANLAILAFFKYSALLSNTLLDTSQGIGEFLLTIPLPIGISFFTFQGITLVVDTLREPKPAGRASPIVAAFLSHYVKTTLYISFFPQLVAGPIVTAHEFVPQIKRKYLIDVDWDKCFRCLVCGYFLKMVVADNLKDQTFWMEYPYFMGFSSTNLAAMLFGYSAQIFADFAGYSLIAIGLAGLFGYQLPKNFNFPYVSQSISEFWHRWHISLSGFLREYLYIPLGGNRKGAVRTYVNLMIVMLLGGLWHGAAWSYMVWGGFHGLALVLERLLSNRFQSRILESFVARTIRMGIVFILVTLAWLLFKLQFLDAVAYCRCLCQNVGVPVDRGQFLMICVYSTPVLLYHLDYLLKRNKTDSQNGTRLIDRLAYGAMLFLLITNSGQPGAFVYFQF